MSPEESAMLRDSGETWRRHAILESVVGSAILSVAIMCAARGETWHATFAALVSGATLSAAALTYVRGRQWMRQAAKRTETRSPAQHWPSPIATKGE